MNVLLKTTAALAVVSGLSVAQACDISDWDAGATATAAGDVAGAVRYSGKCALIAGQSQSVTKSSLGGSGNTYFRFYVYADSAQTGDVKIFSAESGGTEIASLSLGSGNALKLGSTSTGQTIDGWTLVQLQLDGTNAKVWVEDPMASPYSGTIAAGGSVDKIRLGSLNGTQVGKLYFDSFIASNTDAVNYDAADELGTASTLKSGDSNGDDAFTPADGVNILKEQLSLDGVINIGIPDCNRDGILAPSDAVCSLKKQLGLLGEYDK